MKWYVNRGTYNDQRWEELDADGKSTGRFLPPEANFPPIPNSGPPITHPADEHPSASPPT